MALRSTHLSRRDPPFPPSDLEISPSRHVTSKDKQLTLYVYRYRTRGLNSEDEVHLAKEQPYFKFKLPALLVMAENDKALPPSLAEGQEKYHDGDNFKVEVLAGASHWALIQKPAESNALIGEFVKKVLGDDLKASL